MTRSDAQVNEKVKTILDNFGKRSTDTINEEWGRERRQSTATTSPSGPKNKKKEIMSKKLGFTK